MAKCLRGLFVAHACFDSHFAGLVASGNGDIVVALRGRLAAVIATEFAHPEPVEGHSGFLLRLRDELCAAVPEGRRALQPVANLLKDFQGAFAAAVNAGEIEPYVDLFDAMMGVAGRYYSWAGVTPVGVNSTVTTFSAIHTNQKPHAFDCRYAMSGKTRYATVPRTVCLLVHLAGFDWDANLAVPYVLLHECLVHAYQGDCTGGAEPPSRYSGFSEGWMDLIALMAFRQVLGGRGPAAQYRPYLVPEERRRTIAEEFHAARLRYYEIDEGAATWAIGGNAAAQLRELLKNRFGENDGDNRLMRFSLAINGSQIPHSVRDELATQLEANLPKPGQGYTQEDSPIPPEKLELIRRIRLVMGDFANTGNVEVAVEACIKSSNDV
jgi:hypothetical protein